MSLTRLPNLHTANAENASNINAALLSGFIQHMDDPNIKKTHHFNGRYENIYIGPDTIPQVQTILDLAIKNGAKILNRKESEIKAGLWFNAMGKGQITTSHRHDDDDELLSAVYYVSTPQASGHLILQHKNFKIEVEPEEGLFVFFPPDMPHEVTENKSQEIRLSLGINIGPR